MPYDLKGKNVLVTGGSRGLGALLCTAFAKEGCNVAVNYNANAERAEEVAGEVRSLRGKAVVLQGDVGSEADCQRLVKEATAQLGGLDIVINNAGWTRPCPIGDLNGLSDADWDKAWAVNTKSSLHLLKAALATFNSNPDGGSLLVTSSVAASVVGGSSMAYSVTKAAGLHLLLCLAETQGPKIRVNAIQPGFLKTEWGLALPEASQQSSIANAKLKQETKLDDVVDAFLMVAKNTSMTGAKIRVDSGLAMR